ncbi:formate dehydrogenase subunit gamma, partial [Chloroflexota bacterium]
MAQEVERYRKPTRVLHWIHAIAFTVLFLSGLVLFIPQLAIIAQDSWTRVLHRIAVVFFIVAPLIYIPMNWKATLQGIKDAFTWGEEDIGWLKSAIRYYFLCDEKAMPPQGHMNTGQKMWWFMVLVFGVVFSITGFILWVFKTVAPAALLQWMVFIHDVAFIATGAMFLVHIYLSVLHPLMRPLSSGPWNSMMGQGKVSAEYAKSHHGKWYEEITQTQEIAK